MKFVLSGSTGSTVSQILSAVEDKRPLLWWFPWWGDICWVWLWSFMGGLIIWRFRTLLNKSIALGILLIVLYGFCLIIFIQGGWLPLIPSALGLLATGGSLASLIRWRHFKIER